MLIVDGSPIAEGEICPFHQTKRIPLTAATNPASENATVRCRATLYPSDRIRCGSSRMPCSARPNGVRAT